MLKPASSQVQNEMLIGELARRAGMRPSAIRYYESIGLLPAPERVAGRRHYTADALQRLSVIAAAQRAGLSLDEIAQLLAASGGAVSEQLRSIAERKLPEVDALIERARLVRTWLEAATACRCPSLDECPLFDDQQAVA
jgi:MerR family transcriptional regulator, redox-sensitive transcriptional activator SoxR